MKSFTLPTMRTKDLEYGLMLYFDLISPARKRNELPEAHDCKASEMDGCEGCRAISEALGQI